MAKKNAWKKGSRRKNQARKGNSNRALKAFAKAIQKRFQDGEE